MSSRELCFLSVHELAGKTRAREISPRETVEAHLDQIDDLNPTLNSFITVCHEEAMVAAALAEEEISSGQYRGPLHGIPFGVKDIIDTGGIRTTQGSSFYSQNVPDKDAECVRRLKEAGAIVIGKCNTHEFAAGSTTKNPHFGACANPWDTSRVPAGSSGGSGAAVAARMCPAALGSDTGGSIRGPAAICGVNGLKPTYGRVSLAGVFPNATSLDHIGPFARSSRDCALILQGMAGYDPADPASTDMPVPDFSAEMEGGVKGLRLALCPDLIQIEIDHGVEKAFSDAMEVLRGLGANIKMVACPFAKELNSERQPIADAELLAVHRENLDKFPERFGDDVRARLENARKTTLSMYIRALQKKIILIRQAEALFAPYDGLLLPAYSCVGAPIDTVMATINGKKVPFLGASRPLTGPHNFTGFPSQVVPTGFSPIVNMPVAMQIVGMPGAEARILRIAHAYEQATLEVRNRLPEILKA
jgi:aspartyl-tRNA(Asn)/glutamyl-tRNA(Gln) amidotransferase subunit A